MHIGELLAEHLLQADEEQVLSKRLAGYFAVLKSNDYVYVRSCLQLEHMPASPSPADRQLSKRGWERSMQDWRHILKKIRNRIQSSTDLLSADGFAMAPASA